MTFRKADFIPHLVDFTVLKVMATKATTIWHKSPEMAHIFAILCTLEEYYQDDEFRAVFNNLYRHYQHQYPLEELNMVALTKLPELLEEKFKFFKLYNLKKEKEEATKRNKRASKLGWKKRP